MHRSERGDGERVKGTREERLVERKAEEDEQRCIRREAGRETERGYVTVNEAKDSEGRREGTKIVRQKTPRANRDGDRDRARARERERDTKEGKNDHKGGE